MHHYVRISVDHHISHFWNLGLLKPDLEDKHFSYLKICNLEFDFNFVTCFSLHTHS